MRCPAACRCACLVLLLSACRLQGVIPISFSVIGIAEQKSCLMGCIAYHSYYDVLNTLNALLQSM